MAQMELIHWDCKGKLIEKDGQWVKGQIAYTCQTCDAVFIYDDDGLVYWYKTGITYLARELTWKDPIDLANVAEEHGIDISELAREISCEGRVM